MIPKIGVGEAVNCFRSSNPYNIMQAKSNDAGCMIMHCETSGTIKRNANHRTDASEKGKGRKRKRKGKGKEKKVKKDM